MSCPKPAMARRMLFLCWRLFLSHADQRVERAARPLRARWIEEISFRETKELVMTSATNKRRQHNYVTSNAVMPSTDEGASGFIERLLRMLTHHRFGQEEVIAIQAAVKEALTNAIIHGNESKPEKHVHVIFTMGSTEFSIRIQDKGAGFDPNRLASQSGQGLVLMRRYMDAVRFNRKGNIVTLTLRRRSAADKNC